MTDQGFCRVGKRGGSWDGLVDGGNPRGLISDGRHQALAAEVSWQPAEPRPLLTLLPRWKSKLTKQKNNLQNVVMAQDWEKRKRERGRQCSTSRR